MLKLVVIIFERRQLILKRFCSMLSTSQYLLNVIVDLLIETRELSIFHIDVGL